MLERRALFLDNYSMKFKAGFGKHETTCFIPGIGMIGYGQTHNIVKEVGTPLFARAMFMQDEHNKNFIMVHLEQCFVSMAISEEVLKRINTEFPDWKISSENLMITAQHTHSGPGGYGHYPFYNFTVPGFQQRIFNAICDGVIEAIRASRKELASVSIHWGKHVIGDDKEVAFNRSMGAYLNNQDALKIKKEEKHLAINREMEGLIFYDDQGNEKAYINWFGVHATSVSSYNQRIHHDNKGVAAALYEKKHPGTIAFYMQEAAGDVSPNFLWDKKNKRIGGKFTDQFESTDYNGEIQFRESEKTGKQKEILGNIECFHQFMDMSLEVAPAAHGVAFFEGTAEGQGISKHLGNVLRVVSKFVKIKNLVLNPELHQKFYDAQAPKDILLDHRSGAFIGIPLSFWKKLPPLPEPAVEALRRSAVNESINTLPWAPVIIPFQIIIIGPILIAAVPGEITTTSAKRLKTAIQTQLKDSKIERVIISSYSNAFMGYITTPEEYATQSYEAGHTLYGNGTLRGIIKGFIDIVEEYQYKKVNPLKIKTPFHFPADELARRTVL
jgi:neutral ceramidase